MKRRERVCMVLRDTSTRNTAASFPTSQFWLCLSYDDISAIFISPMTELPIIANDMSESSNLTPLQRLQNLKPIARPGHYLVAQILDNLTAS